VIEQKSLVKKGGSWVNFLKHSPTPISTNRWLPETSVGSLDKIPLHAEEATVAQRRVCADAGHLPLLPR
jgi:hypothetical protein